MTMNRLKTVTLVSLMAITFPALSINVGEVTAIMDTSHSMHAREIANSTDQARFVSVSVERISSPMEGGKVITMASRDELLSTPASLILPGQSKENFRFIYKGPQDDKERYYRISWSDEPVTEYDASQGKKQGQATTSAVIGTILVVAPRQERFDYTHQGGTVTNTGNTTFRVISYGPCRDKSRDIGKGCRERYYVMPGVSVTLQHTDLTNKKTHIGIWHGDTFINVNQR